MKRKTETNDVVINLNKLAEKYLTNYKKYIETREGLLLSDEEALVYCYQTLLRNGEAPYELFQLIYNIDKLVLNNYSLLKTAKKLGIKPKVYFQSEKLLVDNLIELLNTNFNLIKKVHPTDFEFIIARLLEKLNYKVEVTSQTRDKGFDIIAISGDKLPVKQLIECKRYRNKVDINTIRSFQYVVEKEKANQGVLFTTSTYTRDAILEAKHLGHKIHLIDGEKIQEWIKENIEVDNDLKF